MGYDVHITRKQEWYSENGPEISLQEWLHYVEHDPEMRLDGYAEASTPRGATLRTEDPSMAVWIGHPEHGKMNGMAWIWLWRGNVQAKNPDNETLKKMWKIAQVLGGNVQGDEFELYDSNGSMIRGTDSISIQASKSATKPWWHLWQGFRHI